MSLRKEKDPGKYFCLILKVSATSFFRHATRMKPQNPHTVLVNDILAVYENSPLIWVWKNNSGTAFFGKRRVSFGMAGSADIIGLTKTGQFIGIECKTGTGRLDTKQKEFCTAITRFNGFYLVARSVECVAKCLHNLGLD